MFRHLSRGASLAKFLLVLGLATVLAWPTSAQETAEGSTPFFGDAPKGLANRPDFAVQRSRTVDPNLDQLNDESIVLNLFEDVTFLAVRDKVDSGFGGSSIWVGHLDGVPQSQVILVDVEGDLSGTIKWPGNIYAVRPLGGGQHAIDQIDPELLPPHAQPLLRQAPGLSSGEEQAESEGTSEESLPSSQSITSNQNIDVLVVYTEAARARYNPADGDATGIEGMIQVAIVESNNAYANSNVGITLQIADLRKVDYDETGSGMSQSLQDLTTIGDGLMDEVHGWRDDSYADMVSLITEDDDYCGVAWLMQDLDVSFESGAFSVVFSTCLNRHTFDHELGHGMGSMHDRANSNVPGVFPYSYGHNSSADNWYTVMSYSCGGSCTRIGQFSNPDVFVNSVPTGIDHDSDPANSADNARSLNNSAFTVSLFRQVDPADPPNGVVSSVTATVVSFNQIDLSWSFSGDNQWTFEIERRDVYGSATWEPIDFIPGNFTGYADMTAYPETTYVYQVRATNPKGASPWALSNEATTEAAPPYTDDTAVGETYIFGNVGGDFTNTASDDGVSQTIAEKVTGGKPSRRTSKADHEWTFNVTGGNSVTLFVKASMATASSDDDVFDFYYSTDAYNYYPVLTIDETTDGSTYQSASLPSTLIGTVFLRVIDTDRTPGNKALDSFTVDHMFIRSEVAFGDPPDAPTFLTAALGPTGNIELDWTQNSDDEYGFKVYRWRDGETKDPNNPVGSTGADVTTYSDGGLSSSTTYHYEVHAFNAVGESPASNMASADTPPGIDLMLDPYKVKGSKNVYIWWRGVTTDRVNIYLNDEFRVNVSNSVTVDPDIFHIYTDRRLPKQGPYFYMLCEINNGTCSSIVEAVF